VKVLIADDDLMILDLIDDYLTGEHLDVTRAASGMEALKAIEKEQFDLVILDVKMPFMGGLEVLKILKSDHPHVPVIMLTGKGELTDRIVGLELGADDYIVKPFDLRELLARIRCVTRRGGKNKETDGSLKPVANLIELDMEKRRVTRGGEPVTLTSVEFEILALLIRNKGIALSREKIMDRTRGRDFLAFDRSIDLHISHLRQKLEHDPKNPVLIKTVWNVGYVYTGGH
jgi:DNA-binding response OmpR family regulator